jgi:hypothetical protein
MKENYTMNWTMILVLLFCGGYSWTENEAASPGTAVNMRIEPLKNPIKVGENVSIKVMITNNTNEMLVLHYVPDLSTFNIHIHDAEGNIPKETGEGCKRHRSKACASERQNGGSGSSRTLYVQPGKETDIIVDVSMDYLLNYPSTFTVDITEDDFIAVAAPVGTDIFSLDRYPRKKLGILHSNSISIQVVQ